ncbi:MAG: hypothetical protein IPK02_18215 [Candidatus Accumulibacter sp.]|uniref:Uncharacterized protein n=1 Tax=Candidatus Accumulibacter affinis TaxID=2954384 RepID=A0A935TG64_9PROT|nr:hypothetical protein [Candidatus Accumulibacter affinis]
MKEFYLFGRLVIVETGREGFGIRVTPICRYEVQIGFGYHELRNVGSARTLKEAGDVMWAWASDVKERYPDEELIIRVVDRKTGVEVGLVDVRSVTTIVMSGYLGKRRFVK